MCLKKINTGSSLHHGSVMEVLTKCIRRSRRKTRPIENAFVFSTRTWLTWTQVRAIRLYFSMAIRHRLTFGGTSYLTCCHLAVASRQTILEWEIPERLATGHTVLSIINATLTPGSKRWG